MTISFKAPARKVFIKPSDLEGHIVALEVHLFDPSLQTPFGEKPAVSLTVHDIDDEMTYPAQQWINTLIVVCLEPRVGSTVLGRIEKGTPKPGQQAPWQLRDATGDAVAVGRAETYIESRTK